MILLILTSFFNFILGGEPQVAELIPVKVNTTSSFRSVSVVNDKVVWLSGTNGTVCRSVDGGLHFDCLSVMGFETADFRSLYAFDDSNAVIANTGSPAQILRTANGGISWEVVYEKFNPDAFFDGIDFWNEQDGIIYGDPIDGQMLILVTTDGGRNWNQVANATPAYLASGEASFAASGTNIRCFNNGKVIVASGGMVSRLFVSNDKGQSWEIFPTPILQGTPSRGIFSFDFINEKEGVIVGGDYTNDSLSENNVFYSLNDAHKWEAPKIGTRGYRECVIYLSNSTLLCVGPSGIDVSYNGALDWKPFSNEKGFHVIRKSRNGSLVVLAGTEGKVAILEK